MSSATAPTALDTPALEGMAAYIVPLDIIGTDPVRVETNNEAVQVAGATNFFGYPPTAGTDQDCGPQNREDLRGDREQSLEIDRAQIEDGEKVLREADRRNGGIHRWRDRTAARSGTRR